MYLESLVLNMQLPYRRLVLCVASPRRWLEIQSLKSLADILNQNLHFNKSPGEFRGALEFEN